MKLYEYEAKNILTGYGLPVPKRALITSTNQTVEVAGKLKPPFAVKAQVLIAGRGKAGGILFADSPEAAEKTAEKLLKTNVKGIPVKKVLIEEQHSIRKELYCGVMINRFSRSYVFIASAAGGMEIEEIAEKTPQAVLKVSIDPQQGFKAFKARQIARKLGYRGPNLVKLARIFKKLYQASMDYDALLIEINPLAEIDEGAFIALDAHIIMDDNALFRHPKYKKSC